MSAAEPYIHGHDESVVAQHALRTADEAAAFLLPSLQPGMRVLDVGCGPGTITAGLAAAVAPGEVVGIDTSEEIVAAAGALAHERRLANLRFEVGSVYELNYPDGSFDVVYAHQVMQHLARPPAALSEMQRVLRPGGLIALRDVDYSSSIFYPREPTIDEFLNLYHRVAVRAGGDDRAGSRLKAWLAGARFSNLVITSETWTFTDEASVRRWGYSWAERVTGSNLARQALEYGLADAGQLSAIAAGWRRWADSPDAFFAMTHVAALGQRIN